MIHGSQRRTRNPSPRLALVAVLLLTWLSAMLRPHDKHMHGSDSLGSAQQHFSQGRDVTTGSIIHHSSSCPHMPRPMPAACMAGGETHPRIATPSYVYIQGAYPSNVTFFVCRDALRVINTGLRRHTNATSLITRHGAPASLSTWDGTLHALLWMVLVVAIIFAIARAVQTAYRDHALRALRYQLRPRRIHRRWRHTRPTGVLARRQWRATWTRFKFFAHARTAKSGFRHRTHARRPPRVASALLADLTSAHFSRHRLRRDRRRPHRLNPRRPTAR